MEKVELELFAQAPNIARVKPDQITQYCDRPTWLFVQMLQPKNLKAAIARKFSTSAPKIGFRRVHALKSLDQKGYILVGVVCRQVGITYLLPICERGFKVSFYACHTRRRAEPRHLGGTVFRQLKQPLGIVRSPVASLNVSRIEQEFAISGSQFDRFVENTERLIDSA